MNKKAHVAPEASFHAVDMHVGARVRFRRNHLGISQESLAAALGISFQQVQKYEMGVNRISASMLYHIAHALLCTEAFFFEGLPGVGAKQHDYDGHDVRLFIGSAAGMRIVSSWPRLRDDQKRAFADAIEASQVTVVPR